MRLQIEIHVDHVHARGIGDDVVMLAIMGHRDGIAVLFENLIADDVMTVPAQDAAQEHHVERVRVRLRVDVTRKILDREALSGERVSRFDEVMRQSGLIRRIT